MASIIDDDVIERVKRESDIVDVIGRYTKLEKKGRSYMGLCPFHSEKTPSFSVQREKGYYHCFGCGVGGDVIKFLMEKENLGFIEAVEQLAEALHIDLKPGYRNDKIEKKKTRIAEMNRETAIFYMKLLSRNPYALRYLSSRGIGREMILAFGLGFAPAGGDMILKHLEAKGYTREEMLEANLISYNEKRDSHYDRFRNRIIFPIVDTKSRVVGFGGRVLDDSLPKYLNSSDTPLYKKSRELYGLNRLIKVSDRERILLVEGYMDVITLHAAGIGYAVASLGTSLTREQARMIKRYGKKVYICYDGDGAGQKATVRAIEVLNSESVKPKIVTLDEGLDPDEYIRQYGKIAFEGKLNRGVASVDYEVKKLEENYDLKDAISLSEFLSEVSDILAKIKSPVERDVFASKYAEIYGVRPESLSLEVERGTQASFVREDKEIESPPDKRENLWLRLLQYGLEDEDFFAILRARDEWKYALSRGEGKLFQWMEDLYGQNLTAAARKERFFDVYPELIERFASLPRGMDLIHGEAIVNELIDRIYEESLKDRRANLLRAIERIENGGEKNQEEARRLDEKLHELNEINRRLHEMEKEDRA